MLSSLPPPSVPAVTVVSAREVERRGVAELVETVREIEIPLEVARGSKERDALGGEGVYTKEAGGTNCVGNRCSGAARCYLRGVGGNSESGEGEGWLEGGGVAGI